MFLNYLVEIVEIKNMNGTPEKAFRLNTSLLKYAEIILFPCVVPSYDEFMTFYISSNQ